MATLRLFAGLREMAGTNRIESDATTVGDVLDQVAADIGPSFAAGIETAQIWVNGDQADRETTVGPADEVAVIPPVSGGAISFEDPPDRMRAILTASLWATLLIANLISLQIFTVAVVGVTLAWLWDLADVIKERHHPIQVIPAMVAASAGALGAHIWGTEGFAAGVVIGVALTLGWATLDKTNRPTEQFAVVALIATVSPLATGSAILVRSDSATLVSIYLAIAGIAAVAAWVGRSFGGASLDPNLAILLATLTTGALASLLTDTVDIVVALLTSAITAGGLIAGRALGSILRTGNVLHTIRPAGLLTMSDPAILGISTWWISFLLFSEITAAP